MVTYVGIYTAHCVICAIWNVIINVIIDGVVRNIKVAPYLTVGELSDSLRSKYVAAITPTNATAEDVYADEFWLKYGMYLLLLWRLPRRRCCCFTGYERFF